MAFPGLNAAVLVRACVRACVCMSALHTAVDALNSRRCGSPSTWWKLWNFGRDRSKSRSQKRVQVSTLSVQRVNRCRSLRTQGMAPCGGSQLRPSTSSRYLAGLVMLREPPKAMASSRRLSSGPHSSIDLGCVRNSPSSQLPGTAREGGRKNQVVVHDPRPVA